MRKRVFATLMIMCLVGTTVLSGCGKEKEANNVNEIPEEIENFEDEDFVDDELEYDEDYIDEYSEEEYWNDLYEIIMAQTIGGSWVDPSYFTTFNVEENLPASFDLREYGFVTPVRSQQEFGTCWAFGTSAAAETSILSSMGITADEFEEKYGVPVTLSTKHLGYFSHRHLPGTNDPDYKCYNNQDGEGFYFASDKPNAEYSGNFLIGAVTTYASGTGPVLEADYPYCPDGYTREEFLDALRNGSVEWNDADWSMDEEHRFDRSFELIDANKLPTPVFKRNTDDGVEYEYRDLATKIIKSELYNGRGVAIAYKADTAMQGQEADNSFINVNEKNPTYAQYVDDPTLWADHVVCIVGYDDNYSVDNFVPEHRPPRDGAFICKNSWGCTDAEDPLDYEEWGYEGSGYFYLSYYDMSMVSAYSYSFDPRIIDGTDYDVFIDGYDFISSFNDINSIRVDHEVKMANVYTADSDMELKSVSVLTDGFDSDVYYTVYELKDNFENPEDGEVLASLSIEYDYPGYHRTDFTKPISIEEGKKYSIVETIIDNTSDGELYEIVMNGVNPAEEEESVQEGKVDAGTSIVVVNPGESYICNDGMWKDEVDMLDDMYDYFGGVDYIFDNFPIKGYIDVK